MKEFTVVHIPGCKKYLYFPQLYVLTKKIITRARAEKIY